jgi:Methyltransferase domain
MKCIICDVGMSYYFSKFIDYHNLGNVDYWRCTHCGFVSSATHFEMSQGEWEQLNAHFHGDLAVMKNNPDNNPPPYAEQAHMLDLMYRHGLLKGEPWLDWGAGQGELSKILLNQYRLMMMNYDQFIRPSINVLTEETVRPGGYNLVLSSAVFEHVRNRATLDQIDRCVSRTDGALAVHTLVRSHVPNDPNWMYLLPVHCAFHTNRSMQILMDQWGYHSRFHGLLALKYWVLTLIYLWMSNVLFENKRHYKILRIAKHLFFVWLSNTVFSYSLWCCNYFSCPNIACPSRCWA